MARLSAHRPKDSQLTRPGADAPYSAKAMPFDPVRTPNAQPSASSRQVFTAASYFFNHPIRLFQRKRVHPVGSTGNLYIARGLRLINGQGEIVVDPPTG